MTWPSFWLQWWRGGYSLCRTMQVGGLESRVVVVPGSVGRLRGIGHVIAISRKSEAPSCNAPSEGSRIIRRYPLILSFECKAINRAALARCFGLLGLGRIGYCHTETLESTSLVYMFGHSFAYSCQWTPATYPRARNFLNAPTIWFPTSNMASSAENTSRHSS